ncbi:MAG: response regulator [Halobacteriovoraceae bacterium]|jgi:DNA-binding NtrC family response regulator|nr:response regulator [Halobacteriovoraceae bacterium]
MGEHDSVLVLDDEEAIREVVCEALEDHFGDIRTAPDLATAKTHLEATAFDVVILDINLKGENGGEILKFLKDNETPNKEVPILIISGLLNPEFMERNQERIEMLEKPFGQTKLLEKINKLLNLSDKANAPEPEEPEQEEPDLDDDLKDILGS